MFQEILNRIFTFPNSDAFTVVTYAFNGILNQFDKFFSTLPAIAIGFGAISTVIGFGVTVTRKFNDEGMIGRHRSWSKRMDEKVSHYERSKRPSRPSKNLHKTKKK